MGHDISAFRNKREIKLYFQQKVKDAEKAYLRRAYHSPSIHQLYKALKSDHLDGGVSGIGETKSFTINQLLEAKQRLWQVDMNDEDRKEFCEFLDACIRNAFMGRIIIYFG